ncbi:MAG: hypothetical protein GY765_13945, partial [bacterium]|nr:hypothetical protein [bacterium]
SIPQAYTTSFAIYKNKLYIALDNELVIRVYDENGKQTGTIERDCRRLALTEKYKTQVVEHYKTDGWFKQFYHQVIKPVTFPAEYPVIRDLRVADDKVYVITYKANKSGTECLIFDTSGKFLRQAKLQLVERNIRLHFPFDISNGKLYQLVENEDEVWELRTSAIK